MGNLSDHITDQQRAQLEQLAEQHKAQNDRRKKADRMREMAQLVAGQHRRLTGGAMPEDCFLHWRGLDGEAMLMRGLAEAFGVRAVWLPEYDDVADWLSDNRGQGLLLMGFCGRGKSVITRRIIPWIFATGAIRFPDGTKVAAPGLFDAKDLATRLQEMLQYRMIVVDDIGTEDSVQYGRRHDWLFELLDRCEKDRRMPMLSTNLTRRELFGGFVNSLGQPCGEQDAGARYVDGKYDQRVYSRLTKLCRRIRFSSDTDDLRDPKTLARRLQADDP